ncbi:ubiquitin-like domain-containing protein CIP73 isoform X1 [Lolium rigidum]|uniref:ubiquitin-like domain-containing protein CIP73 isoform X1 n=1 Tax=Lolium rigidum TaxID=89674 RepID=UPI001F5C62B6|nr:ubiquitin-like domain-containing protein CIP73 isoform X1 [Lolium rigidum]
MECNSSDVQMPQCAEGSETTIEIKIKTLDSQTYNLRVNKCVPVPLLKDKIATVTGILSEHQRLICRGRVLKDDELLSAYHVEDGHTLHLVVRQPGQPATSGNAGNEAAASNSARRHSPTMARSIVLEAFNLDQGSEFSSIAQILQSMLTSPLALGGSAPSDTRPSEPTQSSFLHGLRAELDQQQPSLLFPEAALGSSQPNVIPDSLTTISQYINFMRDSFRSEGFNGNAQTVDNSEPRTMQRAHVGGNQNQENQPDSVSAQHGLPTAASLAENMQSTRQLVDLAGALLSQLSTQLEDLGNVSDSATRRNIQQSAMRHGVLLQNLGSLLLELGRTTMMLRINPVPSEAVINSGPAVFISPSGPNPLMVPPVPFFPGPRSVQMGPVFSSLGSQGSVLQPRGADIHVRASGSVPVASTDPSESVGAQPAQENTDRTGNASHSNVREAFARVAAVGAQPAQENTDRTGNALHSNVRGAFARVAGGAPFAVGSGVRLVPLRTVVAVPAGISRPPSGSSSGGVGVIYPVVTRIQQRVNTNGSDARNGQTPNVPDNSDTHANLQLNPQPSEARESGNLGPQVDVNVGNISLASHGQQNSQGPFSQLMDSLQWIGSLFSGENPRANGTSQHVPVVSAEPIHARNHTAPEVSGVSDEGMRFANLVREIMPFISQAENQPQSTPVDSSGTPPQTVSESLNSARDGPSDSGNSHQHNRDPIDGPNSKRQRTSD